jgi:hypothetical protein
MSTEIIIPVNRLQELAQIREIELSRLNAAVSRLGSIANALDAEEIRRQIFEALQDEELAEILFQQLYSLSWLRRQRDLSPEELVEGLSLGIRNISGSDRWTTEQLAEWDRRGPLVAQLLSLPQVHIAVKSLDLSYDYASVLQDAHIVMDIRPVFDEKADVLQGAVISHTLRLVYQTGESSQSVSLAMDVDDIRHLLESCKRALRKEETVRKELDGRLDLAVIPTGEKK